MTDDWTEADEIIEEVRVIRRQIWERFDNDPTKLVSHYVERDRQYDGPAIDLPEPASRGKSAA